MAIFYMINQKINVQNTLEKVQYRASFAVAGAIQGTLGQKLYSEVGLHSLSKRRWRNKQNFLFKILNGFLPKYFCSYLKFPCQENYPLRSALTNNTIVITSTAKSFKKTFFPYCINEWNAKVRNAKSIQNHNIFQTTRFNDTMILFKLID